MPPPPRAEPDDRQDGDEWVIHCDGSAVPNPGKMGLGAVLTAPDGTRHQLSMSPDARGCNNEAELLALSVALFNARERGVRRLRAYSDNSVLVAQLGATPVAPIVRLAAMFEGVRELLGSFERASIEWVPRHRNGEADALARAALGMAPKAPPKRRKKRR